MSAEEEVRRVRQAIAAVAEDKSPAQRVRRRDAALDAATAQWRLLRQADVREMHEGGMTYRDIAKELGISFGRVRQILAEDLDEDGHPKTELPEHSQSPKE